MNKNLKFIWNSRIADAKKVCGIQAIRFHCVLKNGEWHVFYKDYRLNGLETQYVHLVPYSQIHAVHTCTSFKIIEQKPCLNLHTLRTVSELDAIACIGTTLKDR